ncbi:hypothetical protein BDF14DRAFT_1735701, partial [Spinellus fusiger]
SKMFVGGLNWETTDDSLRQYFAQFGEVADCVVMRDPATGRSRGFGFLTMLDTNVVDTIVNQDHYLDGKRIDPKRAIPREEQEKTEKIFVGGISADVDEEEFREFFTQFGKVTDATLMTDRDTGRPRGFGFITFESSNGVDEALRHPDLSIKGKLVMTFFLSFFSSSFSSSCHATDTYTRIYIHASIYTYIYIYTHTPLLLTD